MLPWREMFLLFKSVGIIFLALLQISKKWDFISWPNLPHHGVISVIKKYVHFLGWKKSWNMFSMPEIKNSGNYLSNHKRNFGILQFFLVKMIKTKKIPKCKFFSRKKNKIVCNIFWWNLFGEIFFGLLKENISIKLNNHGKKNNVDFFFPIEINLSKTLMNFAK